MVSGQTARHGRRYDTYATAAGGQGLQALSPRRWPPLGAFIKLPALRVVHDWSVVCRWPSSFIMLHIRWTEQPISAPNWTMNNLKELGEVVLKLSLPS